MYSCVKTSQANRVRDYANDLREEIHSQTQTAQELQALLSLAQKKIGRIADSAAVIDAKVLDIQQRVGAENNEDFHARLEILSLEKNRCQSKVV